MKKLRSRERGKGTYVAFWAPTELVKLIDKLAEAEERTRSQELRFLLASLVNTTKSDESTAESKS